MGEADGRCSPTSTSSSSDPGCEARPLDAVLAELDARTSDAARQMMIDMYPEGDLDAADFSRASPFEAAAHFDAGAADPLAARLGAYSNSPTYLSALRHRLLPDSAPNYYTSQKVALLRYRPWVRLSEGLHYAAGLSGVAADPGLCPLQVPRGLSREGT